MKKAVLKKAIILSLFSSMNAVTTTFAANINPIDIHEGQIYEQAMDDDTTLMIDEGKGKGISVLGGSKVNLAGNGAFRMKTLEADNERNFVRYGIRVQDSSSVVKIKSNDGNIEMDMKNMYRISPTFNGIYTGFFGLTDIVTEKNFNMSMEQNAAKVKNFYGIEADKGVINIKTGENLELNLIDKSSGVNNNNRYFYGLYANDKGVLNIESNGNINLNMVENVDSSYTRGIYAYGDSQINMKAAKDLNINITSADNAATNARGILAWKSAVVNVQAENINIDMNTAGKEDNGPSGIKASGGLVNIENTSNLKINSVGRNNGSNEAIMADSSVKMEDGRLSKISMNLSGDMDINLTADNMTETTGVYSYADSGKTAVIDINNKGDNKINIKSENLTKSASGINLKTDNRESKADKTFSAELTMQGKNMLIDVNSNKNAAYGIYEHINSSNSGAVGNITLAEQNKINVNVANSDKEAVGIWMENTVSDAENTSAQLDLKGNSLTLNAHNSSGINGTGIKVQNKGEFARLNINSTQDNTITADDMGILAEGEKAYANITSENGNNTVSVGKDTAVKAANGGTVHLASAKNNDIHGMIEADGNGSSVDLFGGGNNIITVDGNNTVNKSDTVSAVYAVNGGTVNITADEGKINSISESNSVGDKKSRLVLANDGTINLAGTSILKSSRTALAAGVSDLNEATDAKAYINFDYGAGSSVTGNIVAGKNGMITVVPQVEMQNGGLNLQGNILASNGGTVNINIGKNTVFTGRTDDFSDINVNANHGSDVLKQDYSKTIAEKGNIYLTLEDNSRWNVTGQSWVTYLNPNGSTIDLVAANKDRKTNSHALTVGRLQGDATFNMSLDRNRNISDMLYVKKADGVYNINVFDPVTTDDMYADNFDGLRFATVGKGSNAQFKAYTIDAGVMNIEYEVGSDKYSNNKENDAYNGGMNINEDKPGSRGVDEFFAREENSSGAAKMRVAREAADYENAAVNNSDTAVEAADKKENEITNYKLVARKNEPDKPNEGEHIPEKNLSDAGKTILNMAKANYNRAVYMDRLNKRMGEARYIEGDEGLWVRMRHDRTDKETGYKISSNMYELGYDKKYDSKDSNGYHRRGAAIDYMDSDTGFDDIIGNGETHRKGIWLYDTWFGNKGHYTDYIAKWGHLENSFDLYTKTRGEKVSGEYNNNVYSLSAEWGYKDILNEDKENPENNKDKWYIEPQLQMQYARVTGADYTTTQGTDVSVDGIDSLIARAGFRFGKDFGSDRKSTFYVKADVLHEFLGDQDITVRDKTTDGIARTIGYDNDGTWYTVGLGFSTMLSDHSYAFLDVEKVFGNDNDNSYQINGGVQWAL